MAKSAKPKAGDTSQATLVKGRWIVGFDGREHRLIENGVVVYDGSEIIHVGQSWTKPVARTIDASRDLVIPGLINAHVHIGSQAGDRMVLDAGRRDLFRSGFLNHWPAKGVGGPNLFALEDQEVSLKYSLASLARFGSTTVVEMGGEFGDDPAGIAKLAVELGLRVYTTPGFASASHYYDQAGRLNRHWNEKAGIAGLEKAIAFAEAHDRSHGDLVRCILVPYEIYTSTQDLLRRTRAAATRHKLPITLHIAEAVIEFHDILRETGRTPVQNLADLDFLGPDVILGHCLYTGGHSQIAYPFTGDLKLVAQSGASVAHCPAVFSRRGLTLESFDRYREAGVNMSIGTDSYPQDIIEEIKVGALMGKVTDRSPEAGNSRDIFNAATLGGARALGRDDLGRLAPGAKADIVIVDFDRLRIGPFLDPIKALIHCGSGEMVRQVIVNGRSIVEDGRVLAWNEGELLDGVRASVDKALSRFGEFHNGPEPIDTAYPNAFAPWRGS